MSNATLVALSTRIKDLLAQRGISKTEFARGIGRSQPFVSQFLADPPKRGVSMEMLDPIARFLECETSDLFPSPGVPHLSPSEDESSLVTYFRNSHPHVRRVIATVLEAPEDTAASHISPDGYRIASAYERASDKDRHIVQAALGIVPAASPQAPPVDNALRPAVNGG